MIQYKYTDNLTKAKLWLSTLPNLIACDFEVASKYSLKEKNLMKEELNNPSLSFEERRILTQKINSNGLSNPTLCCLTHLSISYELEKAYVIILPTKEHRFFIANYLTETDRTLIFHNISFDALHLYYLTKKFIKNYEDTMLLAKCLLNNVDNTQDKVGLKDLMGYAYGEWSMFRSEFTLENMYDEGMIKYCAIDAIATYRLYHEIKESI